MIKYYVPKKITVDLDKTGTKDLLKILITKYNETINSLENIQHDMKELEQWLNNRF